MSEDTLQQEIDTNYQEFQKQLPSLLALHRNKFALMRHGEIANYYATWDDAYSTGSKFYTDGVFSVQHVTDAPVDLGFFSHAVSCR